MDNYQEVYKYICRVCLEFNSSCEDMVCLYDNSDAGRLTYFGKYVVSFANIMVDSYNNLPTMMCKNCLLLLKQAIVFKNKCENSDLQLKKLMSMNNTNKNLQELVCEYTIFKHYFPEECVPTAARNNYKFNGRKSSSFNEKKTNIKILDIQKNVDRYASHSHNDDDHTSNSNYNSVDTDIYDTDSEKKIQTNFDDDLLNQLEKMINGNVDISDIPKPRIKKFKNKWVKRNIFKCDTCDKQFTNSLVYDRHMQHHNGYRFMCEGCGKGFPTVDELNVHRVAIHGMGPHFTCDYCQFKAARKTILVEHIRLHTGERPYTCEKCGLSFRRKAIYKNHLVHHAEKTVKCPHCPKMFYRRSCMMMHMNNIHERKYVYMCGKCGITYTKNITVRRHLTEKHGIPREMQGKIDRIRKGEPEFPVK